MILQQVSKVDHCEKLNNNTIKHLNNVFKTINFLFNQPVIGFNILGEQKLDSNFQFWMQSALRLIKLNDSHYRSFSSTILFTQVEEPPKEENLEKSDRSQVSSVIHINQNTYIEEGEIDINVSNDFI